MNFPKTGLDTVKPYSFKLTLILAMLWKFLKTGLDKTLLDLLEVMTITGMNTYAACAKEYI